MLMSTSAFSQVSSNFGSKLGINYSRLSFSSADTEISNQYAVGYQAGAFWRVNFKRFYVQPEALFSERRSKISFDADPSNQAGSPVSGRVKLHSLDFPLLFGAKLIEIKRINLRIAAGPMYTRQLNDQAAVLDNLSPDPQFERNQFGYQAGLGMDLGKFTFDARYEGGFEKITSELGGRPGSFTFSVGFKVQ
ncbi:porin family protein [Rhodocytophaga aerolata]|uniref:Porin family protein n=2 Tax=Rhodocytophaga aerolata TaxID=455078 RepID=A0ABT8RJ30_9BACT|nr:porin family protein [Rhodocytophaga aerolata]MDO1450717.1 porin family protein [Rhodocytophaga aerolata]